jgi:hypothetical protein
VSRLPLLHYGWQRQVIQRALRHPRSRLPTDGSPSSSIAIYRLKARDATRQIEIEGRPEFWGPAPISIRGTARRTGRIWRDRVAAAITGAMDRADRLFSG